MNKVVLFIISIVLLLATGCSGDKSQPETQEDDDSTGNPLTAPVDYLGAVGQAHKTAISSTALNSIRQAIRLFHASEGRFPKTLNELVDTGTIGKLPDPPVGKSFEYQSETGQVDIQ